MDYGIVAVSFFLRILCSSMWYWCRNGLLTVRQHHGLVVLIERGAADGAHQPALAAVGEGEGVGQRVQVRLAHLQCTCWRWVFSISDKPTGHSGFFSVMVPAVTGSGRGRERDSGREPRLGRPGHSGGSVVTRGKCVL